MNWWLWNAYLTEPEGESRPFYGFLVQTNSPQTFHDCQQLPLPSGANLIIGQKVLSNDQTASLLHQLEQRPSAIDLTDYWPHSPLIPVRMHRTIIAEAFGHSVAWVDCNYGLPEPRALFSTPEDVRFLLQYCTEQLGLPFCDSFAAHFGGFDLFHLDSWLDMQSPFRSEIVKESENNRVPIALRVWRDEFKERRLIIQVCVRSDNEIVLDEVYIMEPGSDRQDVTFSGPVDAYDLRIFDHENGVLKHKESTTLIREIGLNMKTPSRTLIHSDQLSKKAVAHGSKVSQRAASTKTVNTIRSQVTVDHNGLRAHVQAINAFLDENMDTPSDDRWFPRTFASELDVIDHINKLLDSGHTQKAILVDPFFGADALQRLALRLTQNELEFTVIASWGRTDPDTGTTINGSPDTNINEVERRLTSLLTQIGPLTAPKFKFINVVTNSGSQAFHDRYLLLYEHSGIFRTFLLSNSVNKMAANWPFCMSLLTGQARLEAKNYIEGLAQGYDVTNSTTPKISFQWPSPT